MRKKLAKSCHFFEKKSSKAKVLKSFKVLSKVLNHTISFEGEDFFLFPCSLFM